MIKLHFHYLLTKVNLLIISILILIIVLVFNISINIFDSSINEFINKEYLISNYQNTYILICKLCCVLFSCYLFGYSFFYNNDNYAVLIASFRKNRLPYFYSKILSLSLIIFMFNSLIYILYLLIGVLGNNYFYFQIDMFNIYIQTLLICLVYGYLVGSVIMFVKSYFVILIPYILFIVSEILIDYNNLFIDLYQLMFPTIINNNNYYDIINIYHDCLLVIYYLIIFTFSYLKHEL